MKIRALLLFLNLFWGLGLRAHAEPAAPLPALQNCAEPIQNYCKDEKIPGAVAKCLFQHMADLSLPCKQELQRLVRAGEQAAETGGGALAVLDGLKSLRPPFPIFTYEGRYSPGSPSWSEDRVNISAPVQQSREEYTALSLAGARVHLGKALGPLSSGLEIPQDLYRAELGAQYTHQLSGYRNWGLRGSIGSAGDRLFQDFEDTTFSLTAQYGFPTASGGFWMWNVYISNNSPIGNYVPIPGVLYFYKTATFTGMFGFPVLSMQWTPWVPWAFSLSLFGPSLSAEAAYGEVRRVQYFTSFQWGSQSFLLEKRTDEEDRLFLEEKKAGVGVRSFLFGFMQGELQAGTSFDRVVYVGKSMRNMRRGSEEIGAENYLSWSVKAAF